MRFFTRRPSNPVPELHTTRETHESYLVQTAHSASAAAAMLGSRQTHPLILAVILMNLALALTLTTLPGLIGDTPEWGSFRGNNGNGVSTATVVPAKFDLDTNLLWKIDTRSGYSSPIVAGKRVFMTAAMGTKLSTHCIDLDTGEETWIREIDFDGKRVGANSSASPTPACDGERVYCLFHHIGMVVYDLEGKELWRNDLGAPYNIPHGLATSPVLHDGRVIVQVDQDTDSHLIALDAATGEVSWNVERPGSTHSYATPVVYEPKDGPAQLIVSGSNQVAGYALADGERIWWVDGGAWQSKSLPVLHNDLCIVNSYMVSSSEFGGPRITQSWKETLEERDENKSGFIERDEWDDPVMMQAWFIFDLDGDDMLNETDFNYLKNAGTAVGGLFAVKMNGKGNVTDTHIAWKYDKRRGLSDVTSPVLYDGVVYMLKEGGIMTAMDAATGELGKQSRVGEGDRYFASPVAADGKLVTASQSGQLSVVKAGSEWEVLSTLNLGEELWSTPALADGLVIVRSQKALYCFFGEEED
ncbi:MAG: outer membrane protein assembly factor BamB [Planctomycetota bacterium]